MEIANLMNKTGEQLTPEELIILLKHKSPGCKKEPADLTEKEKENIVNLRHNSEAIFTAFDGVLKSYNVDAFMYKFSLRNEIVRKRDGNRGYPCCCQNGWNVSDCDDCWWIEHF